MKLKLLTDVYFIENNNKILKKRGEVVEVDKNIADKYLKYKTAELVKVSKARKSE